MPGKVGVYQATAGEFRFRFESRAQETALGM